jgi:hypothetical protein
MSIVTSTVTTTGPNTVPPGEHRPMDMLLVDNVADATSTVFQVQMGSPMMLEQFGMEAGGYLDIVSVTYASVPASATVDGLSAYAMASLVIRETNQTGLSLSPAQPRTVINMPGHYRLLVRTPTVLGGFSVKTTRLTPETAALFRPLAASAAPQQWVTSALGTLDLNVPPGCVATVMGLLPPDTVLSANVPIGGTWTSVTDGEGCCQCATNVDTAPHQAGIITLPSGAYMLDTYPARPGMAVAVTYTCS